MVGEKGDSYTVGSFGVKGVAGVPGFPGAKGDRGNPGLCKSFSKNLFQTRFHFVCF